MARRPTQLAVLALLALITVGPQWPTSAPDSGAADADVPTEPYTPGKVLVRYRDACCPLPAPDWVIDTLADGDVQHLRVPLGMEERTVRVLEARPDVLWVQLDYERSVLEAPDDPRFGDQWALQRIQVQGAWEVTTGDAGVVVAVIDTGVDLGHPDLADRLVPGHNFLAPDLPPQDDYGHGTHAAGTIAATMNNQIGVVGVAPGVMIMPLKALSRRGTGQDSVVASAIRYAADHGAWVINMSFSGKAESPVLSDAVAYASSLGVAIVAAAGNDGRSAPSYPAATMPSIAVAATNVDDARPSYSNYGSWVHLAAPGSAIVSTSWSADAGSTYRSRSGTSMAAPHVAGVIALMYSIRPGLSVAEIDAFLQATADRVGGTGLGAGRVNAAKALKAVSLDAPIALNPSDARPSQPGPSVTPTATAPVPPPPTATAMPSVRQPGQTAPSGAARTAIPVRPTPRVGLTGGSAPR